MHQNFHHGGSADWSLDEAVVECFDRLVKPGDRTLETGAGRSTVELIRRGAVHTAITPAAPEVDAVTQALRDEQLDMSQLAFHQGYSQDVLPQLAHDGPLDLVLIDGGHGFPIPQIDWAYTAPRLRVGGYMMIDDIDVWTGRILVDFLRREPGWTLVEMIRGRTAIFQLTQPFEHLEWTEQPFVFQQSMGSQRRRKLANALSHLLRGEFGVLMRKFRHDRALVGARK
ncbi:class I SAM-dependent methyltransferase [Abyssibacter profundi]|uniref:Class I SAM-dependent methyltransferase n=1 Tax=Abyssibacter profundi TaxID=2182787 RepID=A0A363ULI1_9GAMM|nr:class I SAM-dependent methyltransferase [Abyssibacter profundi]PWN56285.1 hypothetical protein DEH80_08450 [Abyssibacter profundi]